MKTKRNSLKAKTCILLAAVTVLLMGVSLLVSYNVHKNTVDEDYKNLVSHIGKSESSILDSNTVGVFVELVKSDEYRQIYAAAAEAGDEEMLADYLSSKGLYEDYLAINAQLDELRANMNVKYLYLEAVQNGYSLGLFDPQESIFNLGVRIENADGFTEYTTNDAIPATISKTEYGWLCSGYESVITDSGDKVAVVGVDIDMNEIMRKRHEFLRNLMLALALCGLAAVMLSVYLMQKIIVKPLNMLAAETKGFVDSENYSLNNIIDLPIRTGDEIEEIYTSVQKLEKDIIAHIENLTAVTAEKERIGAELSIATHIQSSMLPCIFPAFPERKEFDIYASMTPAKEVGGDFYDFFMVDERHLAIVMADVSGKGVPAALFMVIAKTLIKDHTIPGEDLGRVFTEVNKLLCESNSEGLFVTAFEGVLDLVTGEFSFVNAGHEIPYICKKGNGFEPYKIRAAFVLAGMENIRYRAGSITLNEGDKIFQYTDGVTEATNADNELYGSERLNAVLTANAGRSPRVILDAVKSDIDGFVDKADQFDDITMLCLEFKEKMKGSNDNMICEEITVDATLEGVQKITEAADALLKENGCGLKAKTQLDIAIDEIAGNIANYAYTNGGKMTARINIDKAGKTAVITFIDCGVPYNPLEQLDPDTTLSAEERKIGGLGIFMVKKSMDDIKYEHKDGKNVLTIRKEF